MILFMPIMRHTIWLITMDDKQLRYDNETYLTYLQTQNLKKVTQTMVTNIVHIITSHIHFLATIAVHPDHLT